jgi:polyisoprenoid-binding protein YceI
MLRKPMLMLLAALTLGLASACGLLRDPEGASNPIEAIPVAVETEPAAVAPAATEASSETDPGTASDLTVYSISQDASQVRFELDEDLRGERKTVVGVTDQVAGEIALDMADLSTAQVGVLQINARTLLTDNNFRNRAIQNEILDTGSFEFITFTPDAISGLPASVGVGEEVSFTIEGDLSIRDVTQRIVFTVVAKALSEGQLSGTASAVIDRAAFNLNIPSVPNVANVEEQVELYIDFVAEAS